MNNQIQYWNKSLCFMRNGEEVSVGRNGVFITSNIFRRFKETLAPVIPIVLDDNKDHELSICNNSLCVYTFLDEDSDSYLVLIHHEGLEQLLVRRHTTLCTLQELMIDTMFMYANMHLRQVNLDHDLLALSLYKDGELSKAGFND